MGPSTVIHSSFLNARKTKPLGGYFANTWNSQMVGGRVASRIFSLT